jgi:hypothetical protein
MFKSCLGLFFRLRGQKRVPRPPAMMTAYMPDLIIKRNAKY